MDPRDADGQGPLESVRASCHRVAECARHVRIDMERLQGFAAELPLSDVRAPDMHPERHYLGHGDETVAFFLTLDAINFGSGWFPHLRKRPRMSGYFTVASSLTDHFRAHGPLSAEALAGADASLCTTIFHQAPQDAVIRELMSLFARAWRDLGCLLLDRFEGSGTALVEDAEGSAERLLGILREMPLFEDVQEYEGERVAFYKRAQLTAADLWIAFGGLGPGRFEDLRRLTIFADNLVPHVLRVDGVLAYDQELGHRIDAGELIESGSQEEIEIRACAVHAVELMVRTLRSLGHDVSAMGLDYLLWNRGQGPRYKKDRLRHRTRTVFY